MDGSIRLASNENVEMEAHEGKVHEEHDFKFYCLPSNLTKVMSNKKMIFATYGLIGYIGQFLLIISAINHYSDGDRFLICGTS